MIDFKDIEKDKISVNKVGRGSVGILQRNDFDEWVLSQTLELTDDDLVLITARLKELNFYNQGK